jgi:acetate kinase
VRLVVVTADGRRRQEASAESLPDSPEATGFYDSLLGQIGPVEAVGYRVVHGGPHMTQAILVEDAVLDEFRDAVPLALMHLPPVIEDIEKLRIRFPDVVAVDTAFHASLPEAARTYALPEERRRRWDLRRYGFHLLSYASALPRAASLVGPAPTPTGRVGASWWRLVGVRAP